MILKIKSAVVLPVVVPGDPGPPAAVAVPPVIDAGPVPLLVAREQPRVVGVLASAVMHVGRLAVAESGEARLELLVDDALHVLVSVLGFPLALGQPRPLRPSYPLRVLRAAFDLNDAVRVGPAVLSPV